MGFLYFFILIFFFFEFFLWYFLPQFESGERARRETGKLGVRVKLRFFWIENVPAMRQTQSKLRL